MEAERFSHVTHLVSEVAGELRDDVSPLRPAARVLPGRHGLRRAEGARDADHLRARGLPPRPVRRRGRLRAARRGVRHVHRDPHDRPAQGRCVPAGGRRDRRRLGPAGRAAGVPEQARRARDGDRARGGARDDPARRQLRLVHVQPRAPLRRARLRGASCAGTTSSTRTRRSGSRPSHLVVSPGPGRPADAGASIEIVRRLAPTRAPSACASATRRSSRRSAARSAFARELVHGKATHVAHDGRGLFAGSARAASRPGRYHSLAATTVPDDARGLGDHRRRRGDGRAPPRAARSTACSSTPSRCSRRSDRDLARNFLEAA